MAAKTDPETSSVEREKVIIGDKGYALGLSGFIASFFFGIVGIVLSAIGRSQSNKIGKRNPFATAGIIIGVVQTVLTALSIAGFIALVATIAHYCDVNKDKCTSSNEQNYNHSRYYDDQNQSDPERTY